MATAVLLPNGKQTFLDASGSPLAGGSVYFYIPNTTTFKNTWQDPLEQTLNTNPVLLDSAGTAIVYGEGQYRQVVKDSLGNTIWDQLTSSPPTIGPQATLSSASTTDLGSTNVNVIQITGTTTINSFGSSADVNVPIYFLTFSGSLTLTNSAALVLPGAGNITTVAGASCVALYLGSGNWQVISYQPGVVQGIVPRSYLAGMTLSNDGTSPNTVLDISAGACADSTNSVTIAIAAITKSTAGSWVSGSGANGMGKGLTIASSTWYHVFAIVNGSAADVYFDTDPGAANKPTGTTSFRRIGSFKTDGSAHILAFYQYADFFEWKTVPQDIAQNNPGTSAVLATISVPLGVIVQAAFAGSVTNTDGTGLFVLFSDPAQTDQAPGSGHTDLTESANTTAAAATAAGRFAVWTNTSSQVRYRLNYSSANVGLEINTVGWTDTRGRFQ